MVSLKLKDGKYVCISDENAPVPHSLTRIITESGNYGLADEARREFEDLALKDGELPHRVMTKPGSGVGRGRGRGVLPSGLEFGHARGSTEEKRETDGNVTRTSAGYFKEITELFIKGTQDFCGSDFDSFSSLECEDSMSVTGENPLFYTREYLMPVVREEDPIYLARKDSIHVAPEDPMPVARGYPTYVDREDPTPVAGEYPTYVAREDPTPVAREDPIPVVREDPMPAAREYPAHVVREDPAPATREDPTSVAREDPIPVAREDHMPVIRVYPAHVVREDPTPVAREDPIPVSQEDHMPIAREYPTYVVREDPAHVTREVPTPVSWEDSTHVTREDLTPVALEDPIQLAREDPASAQEYAVVGEENYPGFETRYRFAMQQNSKTVDYSGYESEGHKHILAASPKPVDASQNFRYSAKAKASKGKSGKANGYCLFLRHKAKQAGVVGTINDLMRTFDHDWKQLSEEEKRDWKVRAKTGENMYRPGGKSRGGGSGGQRLRRESSASSTTTGTTVTSNQPSDSDDGY